jgi:glycine/D-amino acid oxidase-like deaminating enzyme
MSRRSFLMSGLAAVGLHGAAPRKRVVIAGGGIMGASIALHLARRGAEVTLVEKTRPGAGATRDSFAWINSTFSKQPRHYYELNLEGVAAWRRLQREMASPPEIQWGGSVEWYAAGKDAEELHSGVERHQRWGYPTRFVDEAELRRLLPGIEPGPISVASYSDREGTLDPVAATNALIAEAKTLGAQVRYPSEVTGLAMKGGRVEAVVTADGAIKADFFVAACGVGTPKVAAMAGVIVPLKDSPGVLAHTAPQPRLLNRLALGPGSHIKQDPSGRIIAGDNFAGSEGPDASRERGEQLLNHAKHYLSKMRADLDRVSLGWRVMPEDEFPIIGFAEKCPNLYVVATHSGITLSALFGEFAASEILDGARIEMLNPYRLSRFGSPVRL